MTPAMGDSGQAKTEKGPSESLALVGLCVALISALRPNRFPSPFPSYHRKSIFLFNHFPPAQTFASKYNFAFPPFGLCAFTSLKQKFQK